MCSRVNGPHVSVVAIGLDNGVFAAICRPERSLSRGGKPWPPIKIVDGWAARWEAMDL